MNFNKLVKSVLESTTVAAVGMPSSGTVFSGSKVYAPDDARVPGLVGGGKIIRRNKPELITTDLFKGIKKVSNKSRKKTKKRR